MVFCDIMECMCNEKGQNSFNEHLTQHENKDLTQHLSSLNEGQRRAVFHFGSPLLIRAGAGSGKTRVITTKIAYLIEEKNVNPYSILALTFTNKAAKEMKERAMNLCKTAEHTMLKTFHSFGVWFLRQYANFAGLEKYFTIYDVEASCSLLAHIKLHITQKEKDENKFSKVQEIKGNQSEKIFEVSLSQQEVKHFYEKISRAKDYCITEDSPFLSKIDSSSVFKTLYKEYQKRLRDTGNVDFGDLILLPILVLKKYDELRAKMQNKFLVILVDEYQDTNIAQVELLKLLVGDFQYLCVVGDEDQAIYRFRGAEIKNILEFENVFKGTEVITLDKNYRSFANILQVANSIISNNSQRFKKELQTTRGEGEKTKIVMLDNQEAEAAYVASIIEEYTQYGFDMGQWAIIYRTNRQSNTFETTFLNRRIPYVVVGGMEFYQREEIRDAIALISLITNGRDEVAFRRLILKYIDGLGSKKCDEIVNRVRSVILEKNEVLDIDQANSEGENTAPSRSEEKGDFIVKVPHILKDIKRLSKQAIPNLLKFIEKILLLRNIIFSDKIEIEVKGVNEDFINTLAVFIDHALNIMDIYSSYKDQDDKDKTDKVGNLREFVNTATAYECNLQGLTTFLEYIELREELENKDGMRYEKSVKLMSMHNTKGLEFKNVIVTGLEKGLFPRNDFDPNEVEEERRLMYVACTRAQDNLFLTSCRYRTSFYSSGYCLPSMFLYEIKEELVDVYDIRFGEKRKISLSMLNKAGGQKYSVNMCVEHKEYGFGRVEEVREMKGEYALLVHFFQTDQKKVFLPEYTKDLTIRRDVTFKDYDA